MSSPARDPQRRFTRRQRIALAIAAGGVCCRCGHSLPTDFHGDHVVAHARGGMTDVTNGQALCPDCNRKKGTVSDPASQPDHQADDSTGTARAVHGERRHPTRPEQPANVGPATDVQSKEFK